ncbi:hypothetical protein FNF31_06977 [Cafeteria roenbergensis]|uniref:Mannosyltransferase n=1 Tax=Cafeteria roenbergensis TaxID=33653 RepID=A0A5A8CCN3_CAFRO|nr:hypothetical protein FNF31_06977 [Cafeteria roenbergensis]
MTDSAGGRWLPGFGKTVLLLAGVRVALAMMLPIPDCDETFNYWEPTHMTVYGRGMQTWEYSPDFMFRSYAYTWIHGALMELLRWFAVPKPAVFFALRAAIGCVSALADATLVHGAATRFGPGTASFALAAILTAAGPLQASVAYLPSSFTMTLFSLCTGLWLGGNGPMAVAAGAVGVLLGWPFAAVVIVPAGLCMVWDELRPVFVAPSARPGAKKLPCSYGVTGVAVLCVAGLVTSLLVLGVSVAVDRAFYGKLGVAILEIIKYNALGVGGDGSGADLYGTEPWWWYLANLGLNFNGWAVAALLSPWAVLAAASAALTHSRTAPGDLRGPVGRLAALARTGDLAASAAVSASVVGWVLLMSGRAHKEERFLFPAFPALCVAAGLTLEALSQAASGLLDGPAAPGAAPKDAAAEAPAGVGAGADAGAGAPDAGSLAPPILNKRPALVAALCSAAMAASAALSASRVAGQTIMYGAPLRAWAHVWAITAAPGPAASQGVWTVIDQERSALGGQAAAQAVNLTQPDGSRLRRFGAHSDEPFGLRVCVGKEWYRFPAASFLPDATRPHAPGKAQPGSSWGAPPADPAARSGGPAVLGFLRSGFGGQLPQPFDVLGNRTSATLPNFNDVNAEEADRYVPEEACDVIVDLALPEAHAAAGGHTAEPWIADARAGGAQARWEVAWSSRFAHADTTPRIWRLFWVPGASSARVSWGEYLVLRRKRSTAVAGAGQSGQAAGGAGQAPSRAGARAVEERAEDL